MKIVLDTNVLVSGLLCPYSPSGQIVRMVSSGDPTLCIDARIVSEYGEVLARPKFQFDAKEVELLMEFIQHTGCLCASLPLKDPLPDPDDEPFLEVAIAGDASCLVTGNTRHFPARSRERMTVLTPRQFLEYFRGSIGRSKGR